MNNTALSHDATYAREHTRIAALTPHEARRQIREGNWKHTTAGVANGYAQANLIIIPREYAEDFLRFCMANRACCPLLDVSAPGDWAPSGLGEDLDLRTDVPRYWVHIDGEFSEEVEDIKHLWNDKLVCFSIGCSFSFEEALTHDGVPLRHVEQQSVVPMYHTSIPLKPAGPFKGTAVVSLRPMPPESAIRAIQITSDMPSVHGAPLHIARPDIIGIEDIMHPDFGDKPFFKENDIPVFWGCGVTPQTVLKAACLPFAISHAPGYMLITDIPNHTLKYR